MWRGPVFTLTTASAFGGLAVATAQLPDTGLIPPTLLVCAALAATVGFSTRSLLAQTMTPVLVCTAWLSYAAEALSGHAQWFTVPIGLTILVVVGLLRKDLRSTGADPAPSEVVLLEHSGIAFLVGATFVQAVTGWLGYAALAAGIGIAVVAWGALTRVRRRVVAGVVVVVIAAFVVLVGIPLAQLMPAWTGAALWTAIACIGLLAIVGATLLEQGRTVVRHGIAGFRQMTADWE